jgi:hypothetical protein
MSDMPKHVQEFHVWEESPVFVISNVVRNLVLHRDIPPFLSLLLLYCEKGAV